MLLTMFKLMWNEISMEQSACFHSTMQIPSTIFICYKKTNVSILFGPPCLRVVNCDCVTVCGVVVVSRSPCDRVVAFISMMCSTVFKTKFIYILLLQSSWTIFSVLRKFQWWNIFSFILCCFSTYFLNTLLIFLVAMLTKFYQFSP